MDSGAVSILLSIVIVNWNTRDLLRACLASLRPALAMLGGTSEVIVVDNASSDGSAAMAAAEFPESRLIANAENRNYAEGNNQGIAAASGEFVLLLNPDTEVPAKAPETLRQLVAFLQERPKAGAVSPLLVYPDGRPQHSVRGFPSPRALIGDITGVGRLLPASSWGAYRTRRLQQDRPSEVDQPMASAFLVRRAALEQAGLFDPQFPLFFNDVDLCYRIKAAGWQIWYEPRLRIIHIGGASTRQVRPESIRRSHEGLERFYAKHYRQRLPLPAYGMLMGVIRLGGRIRMALASFHQRGARIGSPD